ncbi:MAG: hypothetical protein HY226_00035 [Candidatus Vogelbacteria bacterium]|nr:hypothetical protein [Candidatus Vogelbacteria bacterium]
MSKNKFENADNGRNNHRQTKEIKPPEPKPKPEFFSRAYPKGERWDADEIAEFYNEACQLLETVDPNSQDAVRLLLKVAKDGSRIPHADSDPKWYKNQTGGRERLVQSSKTLSAKLSSDLCTPEILEKLNNEGGDDWDRYSGAKECFLPFKERVLGAIDPQQAKNLLNKNLVELEEYCKAAQNWTYKDGLSAVKWLFSKNYRTRYIVTVVKHWDQDKQSEILNQIIDKQKKDLNRFDLEEVAQLIRTWPQSEGMPLVKKMLQVSDRDDKYGNHIMLAAANWDEEEIKKLMPSDKNEEETAKWFTLMKYRTKPLTKKMVDRFVKWCNVRDATRDSYQLARGYDVKEGYEALVAHPENFAAVAPALAKTGRDGFDTISINAVAALPIEFQYKNMWILANECSTNYFHAIPNKILDVISRWDEHHRKEFAKYLCTSAKNGVLNGHILNILAKEKSIDDPDVVQAVFRTKVERDLFPDKEIGPGVGAKVAQTVNEEVIKHITPAAGDPDKLIRTAYSSALNDMLGEKEQHKKIVAMIKIGQKLEQLPEGMEEKMSDLLSNLLCKGNIEKVVDLLSAFKLSPEMLHAIDKRSTLEQIKFKAEKVRLIISNNNFGEIFPLTYEKAKTFCLEKALGGELDYIKPVLTAFNQIPNEIAEALIRAKDFESLVDNIERFPGLDIEALFKKLLESSNKFYLAGIINERRENPDRAFSVGIEMFGAYFTGVEYKCLRSILNGTIDVDRMKNLGIKQSGERGINDLRLAFDRFKKDLFKEALVVNWLDKDQIFRQFFKKYVRYEESEWGGHSESSFESLIRRYNHYDHNKENPLLKLDETYTPSGTLLINKVDAEARSEFVYSEQFIHRFNILKQSLLEATKLFSDKQGPVFNRLYTKVEELRKSVISGLEEKLQNSENLHEKARENISGQIRDLKNTDTRNLSAIQTNFTKLADFPELYEVLRQIVFAISLFENPTKLEEAKKLVREGISFENNSWLINFVAHTTNEETWKKYFPDKEAWKKFTKINSVLALQEELARAQNQGLRGRTTLDFIPTRGMLMELSGHIADACWAYNPERTYDEYEEEDDYGATMAESFPNFTSLIMVQNKSTKFERLAGACFLLETEASDGTPLLVIRGLNPLENVINELSVEDYMEKFTAYVRSIADKQGRKLAIVIDDHCGGAASNRPILYNHLAGLSDKLTPIELGSEDDSTVNGYYIVNDVYLI